MNKNVNYMPGVADAENYEKTVCIETHENVTIEYEIAGVGSRALAAWVDKAIRVAVYVVSAILAFILIVRNYTLGELLEAIVLSFKDYYYAFLAIYLGIILLSILYHLIAELMTNGSSPGKKLVGIKVVQVTGEAATPVQLIIRNLIRAIDLIPGGSAIDGLIALFNKQGRRVGDLAAGTMVIKYRKGPDINQIIANAEAEATRAEEDENDAFGILDTKDTEAPADENTEPENAAPAFFDKDETEMLRKYLAERNKYINKAMYDVRFAELVAQRRGYEKQTGFNGAEALTIIKAAAAYLLNYRFDKKPDEVVTDTPITSETAGVYIPFGARAENEYGMSEEQSNGEDDDRS